MLLFAVSLLAGGYASLRERGTLPSIVLDANLFAREFYTQGELERAAREAEMSDRLAHGQFDNTDVRKNIYRELGDADAYVGLFRERAERRPLDPRPLLELGTAMLDVGRLDEGLELLERVRQQAGPLPGLHRELAVGYVKANRLGEAEPVFREGLTIDPLSADLHEGLGHCLEQRGEIAEARHHYERALQLEPRRASVEARLRGLRRVEPFGL